MSVIIKSIFVETSFALRVTKEMYKGINWGNTSCFRLSFLSLSFSSCTQNFFQASKYIPDICVIRAVQKIVWASGCGSVQHVFSSNEEISKIYEKVLVLGYIGKIKPMCDSLFMNSILWILFMTSYLCLWCWIFHRPMLAMSQMQKMNRCAVKLWRSWPCVSPLCPLH